VLASAAEAVTPGEVGGLAGAAAELLDELQAVTSKAAQTSAAQPPQPAACRVLCAFVVNMEFPPLNILSGSVNRMTHTTFGAPPWLGAALRGAETTARSA